MFLNCCTVFIQVQDVQRQNKLQQARLLRTPQEPKESEQSISVEIKVRHVSLGIVKRNFRESDCMACVYDWVGSLSIIPEHFQLLDYAGRMLLPSPILLPWKAPAGQSAIQSGKLAPKLAGAREASVTSSIAARHLQRSSLQNATCRSCQSTESTKACWFSKDISANTGLGCIVWSTHRTSRYLAKKQGFGM